jgi:hypothetical protein
MCFKCPAETQRESISKGDKICFSWTYMLNKKNDIQTATYANIKFRLVGFNHNINNDGIQPNIVTAVVIFN